jgi:adenosylmethionine-8-amino-7-oxononanoate aminotransferase
MQHHETVPLVAVQRGSGAWLYDHDGKRYLDAISSWWVNLFGHANPRINAALKNQLDTLEHAMLAGFTHEPVVSLSEKLSALTDGVLGHCFYASDGASAVEIALKMSFHSWRNQGLGTKQEFVCLKGGYHGETVGALAVTDVPIFRDAYDTLLKARAAHISAVIIEPLVQCAGGMAMHSPVFVQEVRRLCTAFNVHLIADEIAVGCGRTGHFFACQHAAVWPDFLCLSKGISGGYLPLSLVMTRDDVYASFYSDSMARGFLHSHSYTGNPLACSAALATLEIFEQDNVIAQNRVLAERLTNELAPLAVHEKVKHFRQQGMIWAFDAQVEDPQLAATFSRRFFASALKHELLLRPIGTTVYLMPPYILTDADTRFLAERLQTVFDEVMSA